MHARGSFAPETADAARERHEALGSTAQIIVKEVAKAMGFDESEYDDWLDGRDYETVERGNPNVARVAWHAAPFAGEVVAVTFEREADAAVETLRRQAVGSVYRGVI
jgi:hypothetical protein